MIVMMTLLMKMSSVGKTSLMHQFVNNVFSAKYRATIGVDILTKHIYVDDQAVTLQVRRPEPTPS